MYFDWLGFDGMVAIATRILGLLILGKFSGVWQFVTRNRMVLVWLFVNANLLCSGLEW